jgi:hypothetical protein
MSPRKRLAVGLLVTCAVWVAISATFKLPPAGMVYIGQSLASCNAVLKQIEGMKATYALDKGLRDGDSFSSADFRNHFGDIPKCPGRGAYTYNKIGVAPVCSFAGTSGLPPQKELVMYFFWRWKIEPSGRHEL